MAVDPMTCPRCGDPMNCHAKKLDYGAATDDDTSDALDLGGILQEIHTCAGCGVVEMRPASA